MPAALENAPPTACDSPCLEMQVFIGILIPMAFNRWCFKYAMKAVDAKWLVHAKSWRRQVVEALRSGQAPDARAAEDLIDVKLHPRHPCPRVQASRWVLCCTGP